MASRITPPLSYSEVLSSVLGRYLKLLLDSEHQGPRMVESNFALGNSSGRLLLATLVLESATDASVIKEIRRRLLHLHQ
jgi:hypothetical protein